MDALEDRFPVLVGMLAGTMLAGAIGGLASGDTGPWTLGMLLISLALIGGLLGLAVDR